MVIWDISCFQMSLPSMLLWQATTPSPRAARWYSMTFWSTMEMGEQAIAKMTCIFFFQRQTNRTFLSVLCGSTKWIYKTMRQHWGCCVKYASDMIGEEEHHTFDTSLFVSLAPTIFIFRYSDGPGKFVVPSGGAGLYFLSTYLTVNNAQRAIFNIEVNGQPVCTARGTKERSGASDTSLAACSGLAQLSEGNFLLG